MPLGPWLLPFSRSRRGGGAGVLGGHWGGSWGFVVAQTPAPQPRRGSRKCQGREGGRGPPGRGGKGEVRELWSWAGLRGRVWNGPQQLCPLPHPTPGPCPTPGLWRRHLHNLPQTWPRLRVREGLWLRAVVVVGVSQMGRPGAEGGWEAQEGTGSPSWGEAASGPWLSPLDPSWV